MTASLLYASRNILAEGPMWHEQRKSFFWVDIMGKKVHEYNWPTKDVRMWPLHYRPSLIVEDAGHNLIVGVQGGLVYFDPDRNRFDWFLNLEKNIPDNRTNDGGCDSEGRLWIGTMDMEFERGAGSLYCIDPGLVIKKKLTQVTISNGIAWSPDNKRMYYIDTPTRAVQSYLFNAKRGSIRFEKIAVAIPAGTGDPDGMCIDEEGMLWVAQWGGAGVYRYNPNTGQLLDKIEVPASQVSSCAFGGDDMDQLMITTANDGLNDEDKKRFPESGNVFIAQPGVKGLKKHKFGYQRH